MSKSDKKSREEEQLTPKSTDIHSNSSDDLRRLLSLLSKKPNVKVLSQRRKCIGQCQCEEDAGREASELDRFSVTYKVERCFSRQTHSELFSDILTSLVRNRLCSEWMDVAAPDAVIRVLNCLRLLVRDPQHQHMEALSEAHTWCQDEALTRQKLVAMICESRVHVKVSVFELIRPVHALTDVIQKLSSDEEQRAAVMQSGAHRTLLKLLSSSDCSVLHGALLTLTTLAQSPECKLEIGQLPIVSGLLDILQDYDLRSKRLRVYGSHCFLRMSAELLRLLSPVQSVRDQVRVLQGVPVLLSLLTGRHVKLLWSVAWILVQLCQDANTRVEIQSWGGVQQLLHRLASDRPFLSEHLKNDTRGAAGLPQQRVTEEEQEENTAALQSACCAALMELSVDDTSALHMVQENGIYLIAKLLLPPHTSASLQCYVFRTLRFLFSVERNRGLFKRLFPAQLFEMFIDVGHYVRELSAYEGLRTHLTLCSAEDVQVLQEGVEAANQSRAPLRVISCYSVLDHLGTGAFGSVYKVRKQSEQNLLALKEVNLHNPAFGRDKKSRENNMESIISELSIIKEQMNHPNIVRYHRTFVEGGRLYIVMDLIDGISLAQHLTSLKEKGQQLSEDRVWDIFIQMCLSLRYLHKEKRIVHRDFTPNNIMLGDADRVTITDFGLAKHKQENSKLTSVVGSVVYSCPEVVKNEPYGEKADIWALGCVLYQMVALRPPFFSNNMLSLANKIVQAQYEPLPDRASDRVTHMVRWCLSPDVERRPDVLDISANISDLMMKQMDRLYSSHNALQRKAERECRRAQKYFQERTRRCSSNLLQDGPETDTDSVTPCGSNQPDVSHSPLARCVCSAPIRGRRFRPASAGICMSQKKLRQIEDPIHRILHQLHKIIFITQLPPSSQHNVKRRLIESFKKSLFHSGSDPFLLKAELSKLVQASPETMEFTSLWFSSALPARHAACGHVLDGVTYQQMQAIIEELLQSSSYYRPTLSR